MSEVEAEISFNPQFSPLTKHKSHIIVFVGIFVFANMLFNNFVWDDIIYIQQNPDIHIFNIITLFSKNLSFNSGDSYRPIPAVYFSALYAMFQNTPCFYHVVQLLLHITVSCLLFLFSIEFFAELPTLLLVLLFLVHPLNVESVSHIGATQSELYSVFGILALLLSKYANTIKLYVLVATVIL